MKPFINILVWFSCRNLLFNPASSIKHTITFIRVKCQSIVKFLLCIIFIVWVFKNNIFNNSTFRSLLNIKSRAPIFRFINFSVTYNVWIIKSIFICAIIHWTCTIIPCTFNFSFRSLFFLKSNIRFFKYNLLTVHPWHNINYSACFFL